MLSVSGLLKTFPSGKDEKWGRVMAVDDVSFDVQLGEMFTLLGPSGCGKSTTLRCLAGLETPDNGEITVGDQCVFSSTSSVDVPANKRGLGMVFQSYAIWPHMTVFANVAFPLEVARRGLRLSKRDIRARVERILAVVHLDQLASRQATNLSGGQQQRLALARALANEPSLILLDEPLSNLDAKLREDMRFELARLQRETGVTAIYVTHDQVEALSMSNRIAVMNEGRIVQVGTPRQIYEKPATRFVAGFIGTTSFLTGRVCERNGDSYSIDMGSPGCVRALSDGGHVVGEDVIVAIRPERVRLESPAAESLKPNQFRGVVESSAFVGEAIDYVIAVDDAKVRARTTVQAAFPSGAPVAVTLPVESCSIIGAGG